MQICPYLLTRVEHIAYQICFRCRSMVAQICRRHSLYPATLECRVINQEATPVLYGENIFCVAGSLDMAYTP